MTNNPIKRLSRRDALKVLGAAAGAGVLANLPGKWSTPRLTAGVLPAHAQGSPCWALIFTLVSLEGTDVAITVNTTPGSGPFSVDPGELPWSQAFACADQCVGASVILSPTANNVTATLNLEVTPPGGGTFPVTLKLPTDATYSNSYYIYLYAGGAGYSDGPLPGLGEQVNFDGCDPWYPTGQD